MNLNDSKWLNTAHASNATADAWNCQVCKLKWHGVPKPKPTCINLSSNPLPKIIENQAPSIPWYYVSICFPKLPATNPAMAIPSCIGAIRDGSAQGSHIPRRGGPAKLLQGLLHLAMKLLPSQWNRSCNNVYIYIIRCVYIYIYMCVCVCKFHND